MKRTIIRIVLPFAALIAVVAGSASAASAAPKPPAKQVCHTKTLVTYTGHLVVVTACAKSPFSEVSTVTVRPITVATPQPLPPRK